MDELINSFNSLNIKNLENDIEQIIVCYKKQKPELNKTTLIFDKSHVNEASLYKAILLILTKMGYTCELIDMMPYIDEYIEIIFTN